MSLEQARNFAIEKFKTKKSIDGVSPYSNHLDGIVNRLKSLGITDQEILAAATLYNILEDSDVTFNEIFERFGRRIAIIISAITEDKNIPKKEKEIQYTKQLKNSPIESKIIMFCAISTLFKEIQNSNISKNQKIKNFKRKSHILRLMKKEIIDARINFPKIQEMIVGINSILKENKQKVVNFEES